MPLHAQAAAVLDAMPGTWRDPEAIRSMTAAKARGWQAEEAMVVDGLHLPPDVAAEEVELPGAAGLLRGRVYRPREAAPTGTVLWIRGGGFVLGSLATDAIAAPLALTSGCAIVSIEYRLAPEHPFPAGLEDCYAAFRWVAEQAPQLGGRAAPVGVGGDSAGGNLAAAVALLARDRGGPEIALQLLLYPMLARRFDGGSRHDPDVGALARPEAIEWLWEQYLGERDGADPYASPLCADTLAGLPPAVVITAEYDVLRDEGEAYAERLERAGVPVQAVRYAGMPHGFADWLDAVDAAQDCLETMGAAFRQALA